MQSEHLLYLLVEFKKRHKMNHCLPQVFACNVFLTINTVSQNIILCTNVVLHCDRIVSKVFVWSNTEISVVIT